MSKIKHVEYFHGGSRVCDTCDYGAVYVNDLKIEYEHGGVLEIHLEVGTEAYNLTESDWIRLVANSNFPDHLVISIKDHLLPIINDISDDECYYMWEGKKHSFKEWL